MGIPHVGHEHRVVTVSVGVMHRADATNEMPEEWFALADAALYEAKRQGRNQVRMDGTARTVESQVRSFVGSPPYKLASL